MGVSMRIRALVVVAVGVLLTMGITACGGDEAGGATAALGGGSITGRVTGPEGPVAGALVQLRSLSDEACRAASDAGLDPRGEGQSDEEIDLLLECLEQVGRRIPTGPDGAFAFEGLPGGWYSIWVHWEQDTPPPVPLLEVPSGDFFFVTLYAELIGDHRVDVSMYDTSVGTYEVDMNWRSFELLTDEEMTKDLAW